MADHFLGEMRILPYSRIPAHWAVCDGALLPIQDNQALFSLLGTNFGGDGRTNFALPDLRGRVPIHIPSASANRNPGQIGGVESVTLNVGQLPEHNHILNAYSGEGDTPLPTSGVPAKVSQHTHPSAPVEPPLYLNGSSAQVQALSNQSIGLAGGGGMHENRQPTLALIWAICVQGVYPQRN